MSKWRVEQFGKKPKLETVWQMAEHQGKSVVLHEEGDWSALDTTGDVHVYRLDSMADKLQGEDMAGAQEVLNGMADIIERTARQSLQDRLYLCSRKSGRVATFERI